MAKEIPSLSIGESFKFLKSLGKDPIASFLKAREEHGDLFHIPLANKTFVMNGEYTKFILIKEAKNFEKSKSVDVFYPLLGLGLVTSRRDLWKKQRKIVGLEFTSKANENYSHVFLEKAKSYWKYLKSQEGYVDLSHEFAVMTFGIASDIFMGANLDRKKMEELKSAFDFSTKHIIDKVRNPFQIPFWWPNAKNRRLKRDIQLIDKVVYKIINDKSSLEKTNVLSRLLKARESGQVHVTDKQLRDEVTTLFFAGSDTTSNAMTFTLYLLALHPEVLKKCRQEIDSVLSGRDPLITDVPKLEYLKATIYEAMRLYSPVPGVGRRGDEDKDFDGYRFPAGRDYAILLSMCHRDARVFEDPEEFRPERFLGVDNKKMLEMGFMPFGEGPRKCIGKELAMVESGIILSSFLQTFDFELQPGFEMKLNVSLTLSPVEGPFMKLTPREKISSSHIETKKIPELSQI